MTADDVAGKAGCNPRLVREWLDGQVAGGLIGYDVATDRYELSPEAALALADDNSPAFVARAMNAFGSMFMDIDKITGRVPRRRRAELGRPPSVPVLGHGVVLPHRLPRRATELDRRARRRRRQARGRRHRAPTSAAATAHRSSCSPRHSRTRASTASTSTRPPSSPHGNGPRRPACRASTTFEVADAKGYDGHVRPHLLLRLPARHGRPRRHRRATPASTSPGRHRAARRALRARRPATNLTENPMAALLYTASSASAHRTRSPRRSASASAPRPARRKLREVFAQAGFTHFRRAAETPLNLILEARV